MIHIPPRLCHRSLAFVLILVLLAVNITSHRGSALAQSSVKHQIGWDSHSLTIDGRRVLLYSGEFHYWRLPSREQWLDRLEKMKAAGLNAVSVYFDWQYHSSAPGQYDFSGIRDIDYLLSLTEHLGLYVIARVGPYMNAEVDAGGLPGWILSKQLFLRAQQWNGQVAHPQDSPLYTQYSKEWYDHLLPILARHQVTTGGSVILLSIENEYNQDTGSEQYMHALYGFARADGITVPIFHNDFYFKGDWAKTVDLYGYDSYPYGFDCCHQWYDMHFHGVDTWESTLRNQLGIGTPMFVAELQGGAFDGWGGKGYDNVAQTLNGDWLSTLDQSALAQGTTILNTYMFAGGTSWGYMTEPSVYTSYDYGAPITEAGLLRPSYYAARRLGLFLDSFGSSLAGSSAIPPPGGITSSVVAHARVDSSTGATYIFLRHGDLGAPIETKMQLSVNGVLTTIPQRSDTSITLPGHTSTVLMQNVTVGPMRMNYSTSQILVDAVTKQGHYLVLHGPAGSSGETDFVLPTAHTTVTHNFGVLVTQRDGQLRLNYRHTDDPRTISIQTPEGPLHIVITSTDAASRYWLADQMLIAGPDLVTQYDGRIQIWDSSRQDVRVFGSSSSSSLSVDGRTSASPDPIMGQTLLGQLSGSPTVTINALGPWKFQPESPEIFPQFDDSHWIVADHTSTMNPNVPATSTLLADDYGFHYGYIWYRGHFTASGNETGIVLSARHSYSVYLNGVYLGTQNESLGVPPHPYGTQTTFSFPSGTIRPNQDNVITVLTESLGHDEGWTAGPLAQSPVGILSAQLNGAASAITWRLQGAQGGENPSDPLRGLFNASGLYGERQGWYLPTFDDNSWRDVTLPDQWSRRGLGSPIGWYRTHARLDLPPGASVPIGITLPHVSDKATIWVNGWLIGRYWEQRGPQHTFYIPQGILRPHGDNLIAIAVWDRGHDGGLVDRPFLLPYGSLMSHSLAIVAAPKISAADYWHTQGNRIVDSTGRPVRIAAVNWSGMQNIHFVPTGLDTQPLDTIVSRIRQLGFNTIRFALSNQVIEQNPTVMLGLEANPDLRGKRALELLDAVIAAAEKHGLRIILDNHRSTAGTDPQENGLWYTRKYPESSWIQDWKNLATRYRGNSTVVGVDLRNEPHTGPPGPWSVKTYLHQGATWGPYKGVEHRETDWRLAAQRGGNAVLSVNPHLLVFVEGLQQYPDSTLPGGIDSYWWGGVFQPAAWYPLALAIPHQLVYSPHEYGPVKYNMPFFGSHMTYESLSSIWQKHWAFLSSPGYTEQGPIFIGEFGTCGSSVHCVNDTTPGSQGLWFTYFIKYLQQHPEIGWSFWALNGTNPQGHDQPNYILRRDWQSVRLHQLIDTLRDVEVASPPE